MQDPFDRSASRLIRRDVKRREKLAELDELALHSNPQRLARLLTHLLETQTDPAVLSRILEILGRSGDASLIAALLPFLDHEAGPVARAAMDAVLVLDPGKGPALVLEGLCASRPTTRHQTLIALLGHGGAEGWEALERLARSEDRTERDLARVAVEAIPGDRGWRLALEMFARECDRSLLDELAGTLARILPETAIPDLYRAAGGAAAVPPPSNRRECTRDRAARLTTVSESDIPGHVREELASRVLKRMFEEYHLLPEEIEALERRYRVRTPVPPAGDSPERADPRALAPAPDPAPGPVIDPPGPPGEAPAGAGTGRTAGPLDRVRERITTWLASRIGGQIGARTGVAPPTGGRTRYALPVMVLLTIPFFAFLHHGPGRSGTGSDHPGFGLRPAGLPPGTSLEGRIGALVVVRGEVLARDPRRGLVFLMKNRAIAIRVIVPPDRSFSDLEPGGRLEVEGTITGIQSERRLEVRATRITPVPRSPARME